MMSFSVDKYHTRISYSDFKAFYKNVNNHKKYFKKILKKLKKIKNGQIFINLNFFQITEVYDYIIFPDMPENVEIR